jgi:hypothetical protein
MVLSQLGHPQKEIRTVKTTGRDLHDLAPHDVGGVALLKVYAVRPDHVTNRTIDTPPSSASIPGADASGQTEAKAETNADGDADKEGAAIHFVEFAVRKGANIGCLGIRVHNHRFLCCVARCGNAR